LDVVLEESKVSDVTMCRASMGDSIFLANAFVAEFRKGLSVVGGGTEIDLGVAEDLSFEAFRKGDAAFFAKGFVPVLAPNELDPGFAPNGLELVLTPLGLDPLFEVGHGNGEAPVLPVEAAAFWTAGASVLG
jgi:hypothetical protein